MRLRLTILTVLAATVLTACAGEAPEVADGEATSDLTRSLLAQPAGPGGMSTPVQPSEVPQVNPVPVDELGFDRGSKEAPVRVVEMSDYGCGYCRQFHRETFPSLREEFIDTDMVEWKFMPYITGMFENSIAATEAAECTAIQDRDAFEALNSRLWEEQPEWKGSDDPDAIIRSWVTELGIDMGSFDSCLAEDVPFDRIVGSTSLAARLRVRGTPTFLVFGYPPIQGALPLDTFREVLTMVHEEATREDAGGADSGEDASAGAAGGN